MHLNALSLAGTALSNPETRYFESGTVRSRFFLLVDSSPLGYQQPSDDQPTSDLLTIEVELWGKSAELAADHVRISRGVAVSGQLRRITSTGAPRVLADRLDVQPSEAPTRQLVHSL